MAASKRAAKQPGTAAPPPKRPRGRPRKTPPTNDPPNSRPTQSKTPTATSESPLLPDASELTIPHLTTPATSSAATTSDSEAISTATSDASFEDIDLSIIRHDDDDFEATARDDDDFEYEEKEDEASAEDEESERDVEVFELQFSVPVRPNVVDTFKYKSDIDHATFFQTIADDMNVRRKELNLSYKFSTSLAKASAQDLSKPIHVYRLFNSAREELREMKKTKSKANKTLKVLIFNYVADDEGKKGSDGKRKGDGKKGGSTKTTDKKGPDYLRELEQLHQCRTHEGRKCVVAKNGEHIELSVSNLSLWSILLAEKVHDSHTKPPDVLNLPLETGTEAPHRTRRAPQPPPQGPAYPYPYFGPPPPYSHMYYPPPTPLPPPQAAHAPPARNDQAPTGIRDDSPTLYPRIDEWLRELDDSADRGQDGHHFSLYAQDLLDNKFVRLSQLADEGKDGVATLRQICLMIPLGTAKVMMKYAMDDVQKLRERV
ncbi:hypothetical protein GGX14DRAFT_392459 [Mycena pura]|uniref:Uncharacterized protein n=1 Tax=Mycena pura TaxID=153505 RepID=A0AAD6VKQ2_9AGAR|nr:hypothetical protein GGX14DRAFT_392459 [Mycena pura]